MSSAVNSHLRVIVRRRFSPLRVGEQNARYHLAFGDLVAAVLRRRLVDEFRHFSLRRQPEFAVRRPNRRGRRIWRRRNP